jgi:hypothetical protein
MIEMRVGNCKAGGCKDCKNNLYRVSVPPKLPGSLALLSAGESTFALQGRTRLSSVIGLVITYVPVNNAGGPGMRTPIIEWYILSCYQAADGNILVDM